ncbi:hypothetical protein PVA45_04865 [Entomospira entomophila]|nr:hypothetical protein PVA45_04865 [Entomospira entomophilus]
MTQNNTKPFNANITKTLGYFFVQEDIALLPYTSQAILTTNFD